MEEKTQNVLEIEKAIFKAATGYEYEESEIKGNKICNDSVDDVEKKADFIQDNILGTTEMRKLLQRMIDELGIRWYDLPKRESLVVDAVERFLNKRLKERVGK